MKILHVYRSEPDDILKKLIEPISEGNEVEHFDMYGSDVDYDKMIELVFNHDKIICWW